MNKIFILIGAAILCSGCVAKVFNAPVTLSTKVDVASHVTITDVHVSGQGTNSAFFFPLSSFEPGDIYDDLLRQEEKRGKTVLVDVQYRNKNSFMFFPFFSDTWEAEGTVADLK